MNRTARVALVLALCLVISLALLVTLFFTGPMHELKLVRNEKQLGVLESSQDLDAYLRTIEASVPGIRPELAKKIVWFNSETKAKTPFSIIYIHGFSGSHQDTAPVIQNLAQTLGANLYLTRLKAHGLAGANGDAFGEVDTQDWVNDANEAFAIGQRIGERVIVIGMSTGASLAINLASSLSESAGQLASDKIAALILLSPNFGVTDPYGKYFSGPLGRLWARLLIGKYRSFKVENAERERIWTTRYRSAGLVPMFDLVNHINRIDLSQIRVPVLAVYTRRDTIVSPSLIESRFKAFGSKEKKLIDLPGATRHELVGETVATEMIMPVHDIVMEYLRETLKLETENEEVAESAAAPTE